MDEKLNDTQEKAGIKNLDMPELVQEEELQNTLSNKEMEETEMFVKNGTATSEWRDFWRQAPKRRDKKLQK